MTAHVGLIVQQTLIVRKTTLAVDKQHPTLFWRLKEVPLQLDNSVTLKLIGRAWTHNLVGIDGGRCKTGCAAMVLAELRAFLDARNHRR